MNKDLRNTLVWMVFATAIVGIAFWQAQITMAKEIAAKNKVLPSPAKTRHAIRPAPATFTGDPAADYIERCEKGLTDQEIDWIIEDFENAGLDRYYQNLKEDPKGLIAFRAAQQRWYHDILVDGLRLTPDQSARVQNRLSELFVTAQSQFQRDLDNYASAPDRDTKNPDPIFGHLAAPYSWLINHPDFQPWNLCTLTPDQEKITWKFFSTLLEKSNSKPSSTPLPDNHQQASITGGPLFLYSSNLPPDIDKMIIRHQWMDEVNKVLPLLSCQNFPPQHPNGSEQEILTDVRHFHPAQLKLLLLISPSVAGRIIRLIEAESR
ncbi:MAG: hypothetical protein ABI162_03310 [Luteolibacter sp.]